MGTSVGLGRVGELPPLLEWIPRVSPELAADTSHLQGVGEVFERARQGEAVRVVWAGGIGLESFLPARPGWEWMGKPWAHLRKNFRR